MKNVSKPSGEFNVCMGGDDGRYGWLGLPEDRAPRRHRHLFARSEFHKTCAGIVDDIGGGIICRPAIKNDSSVICVREVRPNDTGLLTHTTTMESVTLCVLMKS